jgi:hypothetical protein
VDVSCDGILALHTNFVEEEDIERSFWVTDSALHTY